METYKLFYRDKHLGDIEYNETINKYNFIKSDETKDFPPAFSKEPLKGIPKDEITDEDVRHFIEDRVIPKNRQCLDIYLELLGLNYYDEWEIFKRLSGMFTTDAYWINSYGATDFFEDHMIFTGKLPIDKVLDN